MLAGLEDITSDSLSIGGQVVNNVLPKDCGVATVYVTHDQIEAMTMGDREAVMRGGKLEQCDTPQDLYDHPHNEFVAGFMGSPDEPLTC